MNHVGIRLVFEIQSNSCVHDGKEVHHVYRVTIGDNEHGFGDAILSQYANDGYDYIYAWHTFDYVEGYVCSKVVTSLVVNK